MTRLAAPRIAPLLALLLAGLTTAVTVRYGVFSANHADAAGYVAAGHRWAIADLWRPDGAALWAHWPRVDETGSALGFRPGVVRGTSVPTYPPGFPWLLAAAERLGGPLAAYVVAPAMAGLLVFATYALGHAVAGDVAGLVAATLIAANPIVILHAVHPMSDVPAAAAWATAWALALRGTTSSAAASGLTVALAIAIRPNLVTLGLIPASTIIALGWRLPRRIRLAQVTMFGVTAALGPLLVAWTQWALYGSPLQSGYMGWETFFDRAYLPANLRNYPALFLDVHTAVPLLGLAAVAGVVPPLAWRLDVTARVVIAGAAAMILLNAASYATYMPYDSWPFLRFFLPAVVALFVLCGAVFAAFARACRTRPRWRAAVLLVPAAVLAVILHRADLLRYARDDWRAQSVIPVSGLYLREVLPANAVVLSFIHSGAVAHYTGKPVLRLDLLAPAWLDRAIDDLMRAGREPVFLIDDEIEAHAFAQLFADSRYKALDWPARAEFSSTKRIRYLVAADRARHLAGEQWPIDRIR